MYNQRTRHIAVNGSMFDKILDMGECIISKSVVLLLLIFISFNLIGPAEIGADEANRIDFGLYKDGEKIDSFYFDVDPSILHNPNNRVNNLTSIPERYLEYVRKSDDYYRHPSVIFSNLVKRCKSLISSIHSDNLDINSPEADMLDRLIPKIKVSYDALLEEILQTENELRGSNLPVDNIQRENTTMEKVKARTAELIGLIESYHSSVEHKDDTAFNNSIKALKMHFDEIDAEWKKRQEAIPSTLPKPSLAEYKDLPKMQGEGPKPVYAASNYYGSDNLRDDPNPIYLDETIEIQFTPDIIALAAELNHSPVEIFQYVKNNFDFEVYVGSRKGSQQTLDDKAGNDYDLASLLIALFRESGIYSRYNIITAEIPSDRFCNWLGVDNPVHAWNLLSEAGFDITMDPEGFFVALDLVIVEAYLPEINYRGAGNDSNVKKWMPLDPSFKQYQYGPAINLLDELNEPFDARGFIENYYSDLREQTPLQWFQQAMAESLAIYFPEADFEDLIRTQTIIEVTDEILPGTLPYTVAAYGASFAEIPDGMRYKITFLVKKVFEYYDYTSLTYEISMPEIAGKQITVSHEGYTFGYDYSDQWYIDQAGGIFLVDPSFFMYLNLVPALKIDGCKVARGTIPTQLGDLNPARVCVEYTPPAGAPEQNGYSIMTKAGDYVGIGLNSGSTFPAIFDETQNACEEAYAGHLLHQTAMSYLNSSKTNEDVFRGLLHIKSSSDISVAFSFNDIILCGDYYLEGYDWGGFIISSGGGAEYHVSTDLECSDYTEEYNRLSGADGSFGENRIFENNFGAEAVSAIKILQIANDWGITICEIDDDVGSDCPGFNYPYDYFENFENYIEELLHDPESGIDLVILPESAEWYDHDWWGTGMITMNTTTGNASYQLRGRLFPPTGFAGANYWSNGGATSWLGQWQIDAFPDAHCVGIPDPIEVYPYSPGDLYCAESDEHLTFYVPTIDHYSLPPVCELLGSQGMSVELPWSIEEMANNWGAGEYTFGAGIGVGECQQCVTQSKTVTILGVDKLQYEYPSGTWNDISEGSPLYVLKESTVNFKAVPDPEMIWPEDKPIWGGSSGASGTGETIAVTFNTISSSLTDYKTVTAVCEMGGTPTAIANVIVYDLTGTFTPADNFAGRSETRFGLEEIVALNFTTEPEGVTAAQAGGLLWSSDGVGHVNEPWNDGTAYFDADGSEGLVTFSLTVQSGPSYEQYREYEKEIVAPSGDYLVQIPEAGIWHCQDFCSVGFKADIYLEPRDVSFINLRWREGICYGVGSGYYLNINGQEHPATPEWRFLSGGNISTGCKVVCDWDIVMSNKGEPEFDDGVFTWEIPQLYRNNYHDEIQFDVATDIFVADETGRCTIQKHGAGPFYRDASDPDFECEEWQE